MLFEKRNQKRKGNFSPQDAIKKRVIKRGDGIIDKIIDKVPFEMHVPGYQFCGPGIHLDLILLLCSCFQSR